MHSDAETLFTSFFRNDSFNPAPGGESVSGPGSSLASTAALRAQLPDFLRKHKIRSILDIPCGDFNWMQHVDLTGIKYIGADIVKDLVEKNQAKYGNAQREFRHLDLLTSELPEVDLVFCRDCLVHFPVDGVRQIITNLKQTGSRYLLTTTFPKHHYAYDIQMGEWAPYNLSEMPFNFPPPIDLINEDCREGYPTYNDKSMGLWLIAELVRPVMKSITACVDYDDFLAITLPRNLKHFRRTMVVTAPHDTRTQELAAKLGCECHVTDAFYRGGAAFNKGLAMEEGFEKLGRDGWICIWDCDIVMPLDIVMQEADPTCLYGPVRRMLADPRQFRDDLDWSQYPCPTHPTEFAGYFQLFNGSSLKRRPWYSTDWVHAGGCDSDFQKLFPLPKCRRLPFEVLHLGIEGGGDPKLRIGQNWRGRVLPRIDTGEVPEQAKTRAAAIRAMVANRRKYGTAMEKL